MTINKDYLIEMSDIKAVLLVCHKCEASLSLPPADLRREPEHCPNCGDKWFAFNTTEVKQLRALLSALTVFKERIGTPVCQVQFVVSEPS
jgi:uncharacterized paraquat-inducible protein A